MTQPHRILLIKPSSFGDIVHCLPTLAALKCRWPTVEIDWVVKREWAGLLAEHPMLRRVIHFPGTTIEGLSTWRRLGREKYDMVIDLQGLLRSGLFAALTGCPIRVGFFDGREGSPWFYTDKIKVSENIMHAVDRNLDLVRQIGVTPQSVVTFPVPDGSREQTWLDGLWRQFGIEVGETVCVIHPAARWETKRWPADRFAQLADGLAAAERFSVIIVGGQSQADQINETLGQMTRPALNLAGKTSLLQLAALLRRADLLVTSDSGPMHLAAAVGTPVVGIFGPTDPRRVGPYGNGHVVLRKDIDCSHCTRRACARDALCMKAIGVDEIKDAVLAIANRARNRLPIHGTRVEERE